MRARRWTAEEWRRAIEMNDALITVPEMAVALGRRPSSIHSRFHAKGIRLKAKANAHRPDGWGDRPPQVRPGSKWTPDRWREAQALAEMDLDAETIAARLGDMTAQEVRKRFQDSNKSSMLIDSATRHAREIEQQRLGQAAARLAAYDARDTTGILCNDPPVGHSALDRKRAAEARR